MTDGACRRPESNVCSLKLHDNHMRRQGRAQTQSQKVGLQRMFRTEDLKYYSRLQVDSI